MERFTHAEMADMHLVYGSVTGNGVSPFQHCGEESSESQLRESMDRPRWPCGLATLVTDLMCLDFFLWEHMKQLVYQTVVETEEDLVARTTVAAGHARNLGTDTTINGCAFEQFL